jgi:hypothetical protein
MLWTDAALRYELVRRGYKRAKEMSLENHARKWQAIIEAAVRPLEDS